MGFSIILAKVASTYLGLGMLLQFGTFHGRWNPFTFIFSSQYLGKIHHDVIHQFNNGSYLPT